MAQGKLRRPFARASQEGQGKAGASEQGRAAVDPMFFPKKHASLLGIVAAFAVLALFCGAYVDCSFIKMALDFPGGFVWFVTQFAPNAESFDQLGRIGSALFTTILDAVAAGTLGALVAYILAVVGSRVSGFGGIVQMAIRAFATIIRNIPTVAWGFVLLVSFKQAEFTGFLCLFFKSVGFLTRTFMETIDEVDAGSIEAIRATGASRLHVIVHGVIPLSMTQIVSWVLYMIETNFRDATLVGMLTGTGIGFVFNWYYRSFRYPTAGLVIICIAIAVIVTEAASNFVRRRIDVQDGRTHGMRLNSRGAVRIRVRTASGTITSLLLVLLVAVTAFTFVQMDYGKANLPVAAQELMGYFGIMLLSPHLVHYTVADIADGMAVTMGIAVLTTLGGMVIALVLALFAASNLSNRLVSNCIKTVMAVIRAVPTIIWVLVFTVAIGLGSEAAIIGMMFHTVSFLTKAYSEAFEEVEPGVLEALRSTGATWGHQVARGVLPEKLNEVLSWSFIRLENNFVGAVTVGAIAGSGGIGYQLYMAANYLFDWHEVGLIIYLCLAVSIVLEVVATKLRKRFIVHR